MRVNQCVSLLVYVCVCMGGCAWVSQSVHKCVNVCEYIASACEYVSAFLCTYVFESDFLCSCDLVSMRVWERGSVWLGEGV